MTVSSSSIYLVCMYIYKLLAAADRRVRDPSGSDQVLEYSRTFHLDNEFINLCKFRTTMET